MATAAQITEYDQGLSPQQKKDFGWDAVEKRGAVVDQLENHKRLFNAYRAAKSPEEKNKVLAHFPEANREKARKDFENQIANEKSGSASTAPPPPKNYFNEPRVTYSEPRVIASLAVCETPTQNQAIASMLMVWAVAGTAAEKKVAVDVILAVVNAIPVDSKVDALMGLKARFEGCAPEQHPALVNTFIKDKNADCLTALASALENAAQSEEKPLAVEAYLATKFKVTLEVHKDQKDKDAANKKAAKDETALRLYFNGKRRFMVLTEACLVQANRVVKAEPRGEGEEQRVLVKHQALPEALNTSSAFQFSIAKAFDADHKADLLKAMQTKFSPGKAEENSDVKSAVINDATQELVVLFKDESALRLSALSDGSLAVSYQTDSLAKKTKQAMLDIFRRMAEALHSTFVEAARAEDENVEVGGFDIELSLAKRNLAEGISQEDIARVFHEKGFNAVKVGVKGKPDAVFIASKESQKKWPYQKLTVASPLKEAEKEDKAEAEKAAEEKKRVDEKTARLKKFKQAQVKQAAVVKNAREQKLWNGEKVEEMPEQAADRLLLDRLAEGPDTLSVEPSPPPAPTGSAMDQVYAVKHMAMSPPDLREEQAELAELARLHDVHGALTDDQETKKLQVLKAAFAKLDKKSLMIYGAARLVLPTYIAGFASKFIPGSSWAPVNIFATVLSQAAGSWATQSLVEGVVGGKCLPPGNFWPKVGTIIRNGVVLYYCGSGIVGGLIVTPLLQAAVSGDYAPKVRQLVRSQTPMGMGKHVLSLYDGTAKHSVTKRVLAWTKCQGLKVEPFATKMVAWTDEAIEEGKAHPALFKQTFKKHTALLGVPVVAAATMLYWWATSAEGGFDDEMSLSNPSFYNQASSLFLSVLCYGGSALSLGAVSAGRSMLKEKHVADHGSARVELAS